MSKWIDKTVLHEITEILNKFDMSIVWRLILN